MQTELSTSLYSGLVPLETRYAINRTGSELSRGNVVAVDLTASASETKSLANFDATSDNDETHPFGAVISAATAHLTGWVFMVAMETVADDEVGRFAIAGFIDAELDNTVSQGDPLVPVNADTKLNPGADGSVSVGVALEAGPGSGTENKRVLFNGRAMSAAGSAA